MDAQSDAFKPLKKMTNVFAIVLLCAAISANALSNENIRLQSKGEIPEEISRAISIVYLDFFNRLAKKQVDSDLGIFMADIKNYIVTIADDGATYSIKFRPKEYEGGTLRGGGAAYTFKKETSEILRFDPSK